MSNVKESKSIYRGAKHTKLPKHILPLVTPINSITKLYNCQKVIGYGVSGRVALVQSKRTHKQYALKQMEVSDKKNHNSFIREVNALTTLHHPNIIQINDAYASKTYYYIATEYGSGGTLREHLKKLKRFTEEQSVRILKKLLQGIDYIHSNQFVHRDLKLSNIVFSNDDTGHSELKLIDFGQSERIYNLDKKDRNIFGSLPFLPPETSRSRKKRDLFAGDMWAIGVIAYLLIEGVYPFYAENIKNMMKCVKKSNIKWSKSIKVSGSCKHFIESLLHKDKRMRLTAKNALKHPWITSFDTNIDKIRNTASKPSITRSRSSVYLYANEFSDKELDEISNDIDHIFAEIDTESKDLNAAQIHKRFTHTRDLSKESIETMDVESILNVIDAEIHMK